MPFNEIIDLLHTARRQNIDVFLQEGKLQVKFPKGITIDPELLERLRTNKHLVTAFLEGSRTRQVETASLLRAGERPAHLPLSFAQERLWFIHKLRGSLPYHMGWTFRVTGPLDTDLLEHAFRQIVSHHEVLRTIIRETDGVGYQEALPAEDWQLSDLSQIDRPYDLANEYMLRVAVAETSSDGYTLKMVIHHIAFDGWSLNILVRELAAYYEGTALPPLSLQYADYALWQRNELAGPALEEKLGYWKEQLAGLEPLRLPLDHRRPEIGEGHGGMAMRTLDRSAADALRAVSRKENATLFMTVLAALKVLLARYSGQQDICVGTPAAGRFVSEMEPLIGLFVNALALRSQVSYDKPFRELLREVRATTVQAYERQDVPFDKIVDALGAPRLLNQNPVFQVMFSLEDGTDTGAALSDDIRMILQDEEAVSSKFDLSIDVSGSERGLILSAVYDTALFEHSTIARLLEHFERLLLAIAADTETQCGAYSFLLEEETERLKSFNDTQTDFHAPANLADLLAIQVAKTPDATAIVFGEASMTYRELARRSDVLAACLRRRDIGRESLVPICLDRSFEMLIGIWGIIKAGAAYVPIDPEYPSERINYMLTDTAASLVLTAKAHVDLFAHLPTIQLDADWSEIERDHQAAPLPLPEPGDAAYVIYTSGTTGRPKGVVNEHGGVANRLLWAQQQFNLSAQDAVLQKTTFCFDVSVWELLWPSLVGARLVLAAPGGHRDTHYLKKLIEKEGITTIHFVPSMLTPFLEEVKRGACPQLRRVLCSGEALLPQQAKLFTDRLPTATLYNLYGPTEAAIDVTCWEVPRNFDGYEVPIGRPVANTRLYILDEGKRLVPVGVAGELYIGGIQVARDYLNKPELTNERFVQAQGERLYRTGDLARWLPDGSIAYMGRLDDQVKIRGYRIELGEIENALSLAPFVSQGAVVATTDAAGNKRLVGYVVPAAGFDRQQLQAFLKMRLPEYMVPATWITLDSIPLNASGKADRKKLLQATPLSSTDKNHIAPRDNDEAAIAEVWQQLLSVERVGIEDNFFELGGDSITTLQLVSRLRQRGYSVQPRDIFLYQTISRLAPAIRSRQEDALLSEQGMLTGASPLLPIQQRFLEGTTAPHHFNQSLLLSIHKEVDNEQLGLAIRHLVQQHDALRFRYRQNGTTWTQEYGDHIAEPEIVDLQTNTNDWRARMEAYADACQQELDLQSGMLVRTVLFQLPSAVEANRLLIIVHHLAIDGVSWRILLSDLERLLAGYALPAKATSFRQWANTVIHYRESGRLTAQCAFWEAAEAAYRPLPTENARVNATVAQAGVLTGGLDASQTRQLLQEAPARYKAEINDLLLAALAKTLLPWTGGETINIGLEGHGREPISDGVDISRTVGWFTTLYPVTLWLDNRADAVNVVRTVRQQLRSIPDNGLGYGLYRQMQGAPGREPWDIIFNYLGQTDNVLHDSGKLAPADENAGAEHSPLTPMPLLEINCAVAGGALFVSWRFSRDHFEAHVIEALAADFLSQLSWLIGEREQNHRLLPAEHDLTGLPLAAFDSFVDRLPQAPASIYRLSPLQEGILFHTLHEENKSAYVQQISVELTNLDEALFRQAWAEIIRQHTILRTAFYPSAFRLPVQVVFPNARLPLQEIDLRHLDEAAQQAAIADYLENDLHKGFDLETPPLVRLGLLRLTTEKYRLVWTTHHLVMDGWSMPVLIKKFMSVYGGAPLQAEDVYEDYIRFIHRQDTDAAIRHWTKQLSRLEHPSLLPFVERAGSRTTGIESYSEVTALLDVAATESLQAFARDQHITLNSVMQSVWALLLYHYTGNRDVVFGMMMSGRPQELEAMEDRVGMYTNTLPLGAHVDPSARVLGWLANLQRQQSLNGQYQYTSLTDILPTLPITGDLFDTIMAYQNFPAVAGEETSLQLGPVEIAEQSVNYPLCVRITVTDTVRLQFIYRESLLDEATVERIRGHFEKALLGIASATADTRLSDLSLLTREEEELIATVNRTAAPYPEHESLMDLFAAQVNATPELIALTSDDGALTYRALDEKVKRLALHLQSAGVRKGDHVGICLERSGALIIGILAIVRAGGAYVPLDSSYPADRLNYMIGDSAINIVLTDSRSFSVPHIDITNLHYVVTQPSGESLCAATADDIAYLMYTSGSTGQPKGVVVTHRNIVSLVKNSGFSTWDETVRLLSTGSPSFDATTIEYWGVLLNGGQLIMCSEEELLDPRSLKELLRRHEVTTIWITAGWFNQLVDSDRSVFAGLGTVLTGGDRLSPRHAQLLRNDYPDLRIINGYGPTENTTFSTTYPVGIHAPDANIPIGRPFNNRTAYVLNADFAHSPVGVPGQLWVGGAGLSAGYWKREELTQARFVDVPGIGRLYNTGDLAKWLPDGNIAFLGRNDDQVKIRGFRVEPSEIAKVLETAPAVRQALVLLKEGPEGDKRLVAYVVGEENYDNAEAMRYLSERLPEYMMPTAIISLPEFPLNPNGKIDRRQLSDADTSAEAAPATKRGARNEIEWKLVAIWEDLLSTGPVGIDDDFFELGGHSLLAIRLIATIRQELQLELGIRELFSQPTIAGLSAALAISDMPPLTKQERPALVPLSFAQERLWFIDQLQGSLQYHMPWVFRLNGPADMTLLEAAFRDIVERHEVLRTVIKDDHQVIRDAADWNLHYLSDIPDGYDLSAYIEHLILQPYNLSDDWMLRVKVLRDADGSHTMLVMLHHIAFDGWSVSVMVKELIAFYEARQRGMVAALTALPIQYADYAIWQRRYLSGDVLKEKLAFWVDQLQDPTPVQLPTDHPRPAVQSVRGGAMFSTLGRERLERLQKLCRAQDVTLFMTLLAVFKTLLYRYTGQEDISVGTPVAGREQKETEDLIGFFVNTLVLREQIDPSEPFDRFLQRLKERVVAAYAHQDVPFEKIVESLALPRDVSTTPVFQVMFVLQNQPQASLTQLGDVQLKGLGEWNAVSKFDLTWNMVETSEGLEIGVVYAADLFERSTVEQWMTHYTNLLDSVLDRVSLPVSQLSLLSAGEGETLLLKHGPNRDISGLSIVTCFEQTVAQHPDATALRFGSLSLNYDELNRRTNALAALLLEQGVKREEPVIVCADRGIEMIVSIMAALKSGATYVPVDPTYPEARLHYICADTRARIVLTQERHAVAFDRINTVIAFAVDALPPDRYSVSNPGVSIDPSSRAYIIYTSGSTGQPKGVQVEHRSLVNYIVHQQDVYGMQPGERVLQLSSFTFDASLEQIFIALLHGHTLVMIDRALLLDMDALADTIEVQEVSHMHGTPSLLAMIPVRAYPALKRIVSGGERCGADLRARWSEFDFYNKYGPTEATVSVTIYKAPCNLSGDLPIGTALKNTGVYLLDSERQPVPIGVTGELYISGIQLAIGYLNDPVRTEERFIDTSWGRCYRTGDLAYRDREGLIHYVGRIDEQVKIRGHRIEPGEITALLAAMPGVRQAVVIDSKDRSGDLRLLAYVVPGEGWDIADAEASLRNQLPVYMLPSSIITIERIPLTRHGKVDRQQLPQPEEATGRVLVAPRTQQELLIAGVWQDLLGLQKIGIHDNFFELGGHSLLGIRTVTAIRQLFRKDLKVKDLFQHPTVAGLAVLMTEGASAIEEDSMTDEQRPAYMPLSFAQERLWFIHRLEGSVQYHMPWLFRLHGPLDRERLQFAFREVLRRHEVLRTVIREHDGSAYQHVLNADNWSFDYLSSPPEDLTSYLRQTIRTPYDLSGDILLKVTLVRISDEEHRLLLLLHHIGFDGWSVGILVRELAALYEQGTQANLPALPLQYADYALWQHRYLSGARLEEKLGYWKEQLRDVPPFQLAGDKPRPAVPTSNGATEVLMLDRSLQESLLAFSRREGATLFMTMLAVYKVLLYKYSGQEDICVGTPVAGRSRRETDRLIGFFVNTLALRTQVNGEAGFRDLLGQVRSVALEAYEHENVPFEKIVEALGVTRDTTRNPVFQVTFAFHNIPEAGDPRLGDLELIAEDPEVTGAQVDISMDVFETDNGLQVSLRYSTDIFGSRIIRQMLEHYEQLIRSALQEPLAPVARLEMLSPDERNIILHEFSGAKFEPSPAQHIISRFHQCVELHADEPALVFGEEMLTYRELDERSSQLAHYLRKTGATEDEPIAVCMDRGIELLVSIFGILKSGAAYLPLDPAYPPERIRYMLDDSRCRLALTTGDRSQLLDGDAKAIDLHAIEPLLQLQPVTSPEHVLKTESLAYVIYTSGSTGRPKGVMVTHGGVTTLARNQVRPLGIHGGMRVLQFASVSFDASCYEIFLTLLNGACLVLARKEELLDTILLQQLLRRHRIGLITLPPSYQAAVSGEVFGLKTLVSAGEPLNAKLAADIQQRGVKVVNAYGPTENTVCAVLSEDPLLNEGLVTIGHPIDGVQAYILDRNLQPVPVGVVGELCLGGAQLARGYLNRPELTEEKFTFAPFAPQERMYRTGDLAKWLPDGNIIFYGRKDEQVKIRGFRIEPGEVEQALLQSPGIAQAAVIAKEAREADLELFAYVVAAHFDKEAILEHLRAFLPEHMIPVAIISVPEIPLMPNGKIDRKRLPDINPSAEGRTGAAPRTGLEAQLAEIWQGLLEIESVGVHDNFFDLGGHSLLAIRVIAAIRKTLGRELAIRDLFDHPTIAALTEHLGESGLPGLQKGERPEAIPLSFAQERLWFIDCLQGSLQYHMPWVFRLKGALNAEALERSFAAIVERHEVLRTVIRQAADGSGYQQVMPAGGWRMGHIADASEIDALFQRPYDLSADHMLRVHYLSLAADEHLLVVELHHIAFDAWSMGIMVKELNIFYNTYTNGQPLALPELPVQYADYAIWQREQLQGDKLEEQLAFWRNELQDVPALELTTDHPRPAVPGTSGGVVTATIDAQLKEAVMRIGQEEGLTLFMTLLGAFNALLHRYTGSEDLAVGTPVAGRSMQEVEGLIGFFVNTLALRNHVDQDVTFRQLLQGVKATTLAAYEHAEVPFEKVVEVLGVSRDMSRNPVFQVLFSLENTPDRGALSLGELELDGWEDAPVVSRFDLSLTASAGNKEIGLSLVYNNDLFTAATADRLLQHYCRLLQLMVTGMDTRIDRLSLLSPQEEAGFRQAAKKTIDYPRDATVASLFADAVAANPDGIALTFGGENLSYRTLDEKANRLAHHLLTLGAGPDVLIGVCLDRSPHMIVSLLAVLKSGAAYLPLDPAYPADRLRYLIDDSGCLLVITNAQHADGLGTATLLDLEKIEGQLTNYPATAPSVDRLPASAAYVIYTSGSTGKPKGVIVEHRNVVQLFRTSPALYDFDSRDVWTLFHSFSFDFSVWEIFGALLFGGRLVIVPALTARDTAAFARLLEQEGVTVLNQTPGAFYALQEHVLEQPAIPPALRYVIFGGEALNPSRLQAWQQRYPHCRLINMYGITETTVHVTYKELLPENTRSVTSNIGRPITSLYCYVLDRQGALQPTGIPGELYVGGAGVSRGYLNRPELSQARFFRDPFSDDTEARLYRTGDLVRWLPNGELEYLGRIDMQVKVRGYRIELGEVSHAVTSGKGVKDAVVIAAPDGQGHNRLVAYVVPQEDFDRDELVRELGTRLPDYMVPSVFIPLTAIPLTRNGKVDRQRLPEPVLGGNSYQAPSSGGEEKIAAIWSALLKVPQVGVHDNFFELGGHSLLAMRLITAVQKELGGSISLRELFLNPTVAGMARLAERSKVSRPVITKRAPSESVPLSFAQERIWFIDQLQGSVPYHIPWLFRLEGRINTDRLEGAFRKVLQRHEVLRTVIREENGVGYQVVLPADEWRMTIVREEEVLKHDETIESYLDRRIAQPFDLARDYMLRVDVVQQSEEDRIVSMTFHHIAFDGWSLGIFIRDFLSFYHGETATDEPALQYADFAVWQRQWLSGDVLNAKLAYWKEQLADLAPLQLVTDHERPAMQDNTGDIMSITVDRPLTEALLAFSQSEGVTLFMTLFAAFDVLLARYSGQEDICVGTPVAGRYLEQTDSMIGFFVNTLPLRTQAGGAQTFRQFLQSVKKITLDAFEHQDVPFEKIVDAVGLERDMSRNPLFQVLFSVARKEEALALHLEDAVLNEWGEAAPVAKFDLSFNIAESDAGLELVMTYAKHLFNRERIEGMLLHYTHLLNDLLRRPDTAIAWLRLMDERETHHLIHEQNDTAYSYPESLTVLSLLHRQLVLTPDLIAVTAPDGELTYRQLHARANQLAHYLRERGIGEDNFVPICLDRSLNMIVAILGVMKAGAAYVPVDPAHPSERVRYMLEDTAATLAITTDHYASLFEPFGLELVMPDMMPDRSADAVASNVQPHHAAYVIYTSGSTGRPKGVVNEHAGIVNRLLWTQDYFGLTTDDAVLQKTTYAFDVSVWELLWPLISGARLVFAQPGSQGDSTYLKDIIDRERITTIHFVPSMLNAFLEDLMPGELRGLVRVLASGEALQPGHIIAFHQNLPSARLFNLYGPTEAAIDVTCWPVPEVFSGNVVPIGKPVYNTQLYIVDAHGQLAPSGVAGELYIGGIQVAREYLNKKELTAERFLPDTFSGKPGARLYRTGDLARWLPDGNIAYLGRTDDQVKIRGYRIEPGEIESHITASGLASAVAVLAKGPAGQQRLVAYVVMTAGYTIAQLQSHLADLLPSYMVPSAWMELEEMPLTANGKLDKKALPYPDAYKSDVEDYVTYRNETESILAGIWQQLLRVERIGVNDNFFAAGGDSIISIQVVSRARQQGLVLHPKDIFQHQTIATLAAAISGRAHTGTLAEQGLLQGEAGLLPMQQRFLAHASGNNDIHHFNQSVLIAVDRSVTDEELATAVRQLVAQHDALRSQFRLSDGHWIQEYTGITGTVDKVDLSQVNGPLEDIMAEEAGQHQKQLDIFSGRLIRVVRFVLPKRERHDRLLVIIHHLAVDGVSLRILLEDMELWISGMKEGRQPEATQKTLSTRQWHQVLQRRAQGSRMERAEYYWKLVEKNYSPLPVDEPHAAPVRKKDMGTYHAQLDAANTRALLQEVSSVYHTEINDLLLAALAATLHEWSGKRYVHIGLEGHGRESMDESIDLSRTIGWFTSLYPVMLQLEPGMPLADVIRSVKEQIRAVPDKGIGYALRSGLPAREPWDVVFNYLGQADNILAGSRWFHPADESAGESIGAETPQAALIEINGAVHEGQLLLTWNYSRRHYQAETVARLAESFIGHLQQLIDHCLTQQGTRAHTPADYGLTSAVSYQELDVFLKNDADASEDIMSF